MESFDAIEMFDQDKDDFIGERDWEGFSHGNFEIAQNDLFRYIHDYKGDARTKMAMIAIYLEGRDNLGKLMEAESFEAEGVPEGFHRMPDGTIMADSAHGAESFDASVDEGWDGVGWVDNPVGNPHAYLPKRFSQFPNYTVCQTCKDSGQGMRFYYDSKKKKMICLKCLSKDNYNAESFSADEITCKKCVKIDPVYQEALDGLAKEWDNIGYPRDEIKCPSCGKRVIVNTYDAEEFDAQTKITGYTRGKDWEGKPYTGQIFPDHSDLDHELADRNQDGKMASWERAIGNQVARGKSRFKAPRKMLNPRLPQMKSSTTHSSILPYALAVGALATIMGLRNMGGSNE